MKIGIIGAGGVGGYFGGRIARAGYDVTFLARGEHLNSILKDGLTVKSILGDFSVKNFTATDRIEEINNPDLIIICVKAWQIKEIREDLNKVLHKESIILPLQNGVLAANELSEIIDKKHIIGGLSRIISKIESPGVINHLGIIPTITFGEFDKQKTNRPEKILEIFSTAGIKSYISDDIEAELWKKFIAICVSGLLAVTRTTYGELRELNETRNMMIDLLNEVFMLSQKIGIKIEPDFIAKTISLIDSYPYDSTSSLTRDVWEGKPSEIDYQNGTVAILGAKYGVDTPINRFIYNCILPMELKIRKKGESRR